MNIGKLNEMGLFCHKEQRLFKGKECSLHSLEIAFDTIHILMAEPDEKH
jgi:hypothetical protein